MTKKLASLLVLSVALVSCGKLEKVIDDIKSRCTPDGAAKCVNGSFFRCVDGHFQEQERCGGDRGCYTESGQVHCDESKGDLGERCTASGSACSRDGTTWLTCKDGKFEAMSVCGGDAGCHVEGTKVHCDESKGAVGDQCNSKTGAACSYDGKEALLCVDEKLERQLHCAGPKGCTIEGGKRYCDEPRAEVGAPCTTEELAVCGPDAKSMLNCKSGAYVLEYDCLGRKACRIESDKKAHCDMSVANDGSPCSNDEKNAHACNKEGTAELECNGERFAFQSACKGRKGCYVENMKIYCDGRMSTDKAQ